MEFKSEQLVDNEIQIAKFLMESFSLREIEKKTGISRRHLDAHIKNMMKKLKANDTAGLIKLIKERNY